MTPAEPPSGESSSIDSSSVEPSSIGPVDAGSSSLSSPDVLDERGHPCPAPVLALARWASGAEPGDLVEVLTDDPAADADIPAWCRMRGAEHLNAQDEPGESGVRRHTVRIPGVAKSGVRSPSTG